MPTRCVARQSCAHAIRSVATSFSYADFRFDDYEEVFETVGLVKVNNVTGQIDMLGLRNNLAALWFETPVLYRGLEINVTFEIVENTAVEGLAFVIQQQAKDAVRRLLPFLRTLLLTHFILERPQWRRSRLRRLPRKHEWHPHIAGRRV